MPNIAINSVGKPGIDARQASLIMSMYAGKPLASAVQEGFRVRDDVYHAIAEHMMEASRGAVSAKGFELPARRIGRLMREQFNLGFVDVGGWDTHVNQGGSHRLSLAARRTRPPLGFAEEIGPEWHDTVVVVISEFGRTFRENGNRGTDHGHGSVYWVLGGGINGDASPANRSSRRRAASFPEPRLSRPHRLSLAAGRLVQARVWTRSKRLAARVRVSPAARSRARVSEPLGGPSGSIKLGTLWCQPTPVSPSS